MAKSLLKRVRGYFKRKSFYIRPETNVEDIPEVIYFEVDNWMCGQDYPNTPTFRGWMENDLNLKLSDDSWCKENELCVYEKYVDMSVDFTVSAKGFWVLKNCPELFGVASEFRYFPKENETLPKARFGVFREYREENFGSDIDPTYNYWADLEEEDDE